MKPQFLLASPFAGSGKTTIALGLLRVWQRRGIKVQPFKCGPDSIDTQYHALASGNDSVNLDSWLASSGHVQHLYNRYGERADICLVEGTMGLYDGYHLQKGSCAEIASLLSIPVVMVVNARAVSYSVAPLLYGFKAFNLQVRIAGVIFNQVASVAHYAVLREACTDAGLECLGYVPVISEVKMPARHSGITLSVRKSMNEQIDRIADVLEKHIALDRLESRCTRIFPCRYTLPFTSELDEEPMKPMWEKPLKIAVARDPACCFLFREHLDRWSAMGELKFFSPVYGSDLPEADLVYLPGGFPELFARQLHRRKRLMQQLRDYAEAGGKMLAEGGGTLLLARSLTVRPGGTAYEMAGIFPLDYTMAGTRLNSGYRTAVVQGESLKGYEFHYPAASPSETCGSCARILTPKGVETGASLYRYKNVIAGDVQWYWGETDLWSLWK